MATAVQMPMPISFFFLLSLFPTTSHWFSFDQQKRFASLFYSIFEMQLVGDFLTDRMLLHSV
jgi:hypothetical protein